MGTEERTVRSRIIAPGEFVFFFYSWLTLLYYEFLENSSRIRDLDVRDRVLGIGGWERGTPLLPFHYPRPQPRFS